MHEMVIAKQNNIFPVKVFVKQYLVIKTFLITAQFLVNIIFCLIKSVAT